jgi:PKD repeat protein
VVPRLEPGPAIFPRGNAKAAEPTGTGLPSTEPRPLAASGAEPNSGLAAAVFGTLNASGLTAKVQIEAGGVDTTPPDTTGAIGPNHYVEFVNSEVAAYKRADLTIVGSPVDLSTFVGGVEKTVCDPQIKYDPQTERWFYVAIRCDGTATENTMYVGFSKTSDPTNFSTGGGGGWCGYSYAFGSAFEDYPKLGLAPLHIMIGTNSFNSIGEFLTSHIFVAPKPASGKIIACPTAPALTPFGSSGVPLATTVEGHFAFTPEPATVADSSPDGYVVSADWEFFATGEHVMIWQVKGTAEAPTLTALGAPAVTPFGEPPDVPQPGSTDEIDSSDTRLTQAVAAADPTVGGAEAVWTQHTVAGGAGDVVRWYELVPSKVEARQVGTTSDPSKYVFNGAIAPTGAGGAILDYNTGSGSATVNVMAQSRVGSAPAGAMNTPITLASSGAVDSDFSCPSQPRGTELKSTDCRWGDYAGASVDPTNAEVVWGSSQVNGPTGALIKGIGHQAQWATQNFALEANDLVPTASFTIAPNPGTEGSPVAFNGGASSDADGSIATYGWSFGDGTNGGGSTPSHTYAAAGTYTVTLTVTDNAGLPASTTHPVAVAAKPAPAAAGGASGGGSGGGGGSSAPNSNFNSSATVNQKTGTITFTESVGNAGTFSWLLTFQNGKFGVFTAKNPRCKAGSIRLNGKCRPAKIVFSKGRGTASAPGTFSFSVKPTGSALKALKNALKRKKGLPVTATLTFQSALGGSPVSRTQTLAVKLKK